MRWEKLVETSTEDCWVKYATVLHEADMVVNMVVVDMVYVKALIAFAEKQAVAVEEGLVAGLKVMVTTLWLALFYNEVPLFHEQIDTLYRKDSFRCHPGR